MKQHFARLVSGSLAGLMLALLLLNSATISLAAAPATQTSLTIPADGALTDDLEIIDKVAKATFSHNSFGFNMQATEWEGTFYVDKAQKGYLMELNSATSKLYGLIYGDEVFVSADDKDYLITNKSDDNLKDLISFTDGLVSTFDYSAFDRNKASDAGAKVTLRDQRFNGTTVGVIEYDYSGLSRSSGAATKTITYYNKTTNDMLYTAATGGSFAYELAFTGYDTAQATSKVRKPNATNTAPTVTRNALAAPKTTTIPADGALTGDLEVLDKVVQTTFSHSSYAFNFSSTAFETTIIAEKGTGYILEVNAGGTTVRGVVASDGEVSLTTDNGQTWLVTDKSNDSVKDLVSVTDGLVSGFDAQMYKQSLASATGAGVTIRTQRFNGVEVGVIELDLTTMTNRSSTSPNKTVLYYDLKTNDMLVQKTTGGALDYTFTFQGFDNPNYKVSKPARSN